MAQMPQVGRPVNITATGSVCTRSAAILGFYVNSTSSGTLIFRVGSNGTSSGTVINGVITPAIGWHFYPVTGSGGIHVTVGGTIDITIPVVEMPC